MTRARLVAATGPYLVGDSLTYADCASYQILKMAKGKAPVPPLLAKWLDMMAETKGAKAVAATGLPMMP